MQLPKKYRNLLLLVGALFVLTGLGYNVLGINPSGGSDYNLMFLGVTLILVATFMKESVE